MQSSPPLKRRAFLALGGALLAGCTSPTGSNTDRPTTTALPPLDHDRLRQAASRSVPEIPPELPVAGVERHLERGRQRVRDALATFEERIDDVNDSTDAGEMRELATRAEDGLQESKSAELQSRALVDVRAARTDAIEALWWARAALEEVSLRDALDARAPVRDRLSDLGQRNWYVGPDVDTTLVVAKQVEKLSHACENALDDADSHEGLDRVTRTKEAAERVEAARAFLDDAAFFADRMRAGETTDYSAALENVLNAVESGLLQTASEIDGRYIEEPETMFEHDISNASAELVSRAAGGTTYHANWVRRFSRRGAVASALVYATATRRDLRVFEDVRSEIEADGDAYPRLESAERVGDAKGEIVATFEDAGENPIHPGVESFHRYQLAIEIGNADHRMETVLSGDYTQAKVYDAALELWAVPTLAEHRLAEQSAAVTDLFEEINRGDS